MNLPFPIAEDILDEYPELATSMANPEDATRLFARNDTAEITVDGMQAILKCPEWSAEIVDYAARNRMAKIVVTAAHDTSDRHTTEITIERLSSENLLSAAEKYHLHTQQDRHEAADIDLDANNAQSAISNVLKATLCTLPMPVSARVMVEPLSRSGNFQPYVLRHVNITSMPPAADDPPPRPIRGVIQPDWMNSDKLIR